jgi:hypothetical protein
LIFDDHLFNDASGIGFMYSTRIYLEIDQRDKAWLEIEAQGAPGKIEAALMSIWKSASRRDLNPTNWARSKPGSLGPSSVKASSTDGPPRSRSSMTAGRLARVRMRQPRSSSPMGRSSTT